MMRCRVKEGLDVLLPPNCRDRQQQKRCSLFSRVFCHLACAKAVLGPKVLVDALLCRVILLCPRVSPAFCRSTKYNIIYTSWSIFFFFFVQRKRKHALLLNLFLFFQRHVLREDQEFDAEAFVRAADAAAEDPQVRTLTAVSYI